MHGLKSPFLLVHGPDVVVVNCWDKFCTLRRAPRTKETLLDFHEWCRVTQHPRVFRRLTGCQRTLGIWGVTRNPNVVSWADRKLARIEMGQISPTCFGP